MKVLLMAVYDTKSKMHTQPVPCRTIEEGIRSFKATVLTEKHDFNTFAEDYSLWQIGTFDQESGHIEPMRPIQVAQALEFRKNVN